jgi:hypothetical protein
MRLLVLLPLLAAVGACLLIAAWPAVAVLISWSEHRRIDRHDQYWGLGDYNTPDDDVVEAVRRFLAAAGGEMRSGCSCRRCETNWATVASLAGEVTAADRADLASMGVTWDEAP